MAGRPGSMRGQILHMAATRHRTRDGGASMNMLTRQLARALGLAPPPWPESKLLNTIYRWITISPGRCQTLHDPHKCQNNEPEWLLFRATIASKLAKCPPNPIRSLGTSASVIEVVARLQYELDNMRNELDKMHIQAMQNPNINATTINHLREEIHRGEHLLSKLKMTKAYARSIEYLSHEFAWCARLDPTFRRWASMDDYI